jgi:hypothetical protein
MWRRWHWDETEAMRKDAKRSKSKETETNLKWNREHRKETNFKGCESPK